MTRILIVWGAILLWFEYARHYPSSDIVRLLLNQPMPTADTLELPLDEDMEFDIVAPRDA